MSLRAALCLTTRRTALRMLLHAGAVAFVVPARAQEVQDACVDSASESLRASLNYSSHSADAAKTCGGCAFFTLDASSPACGQCTILSGSVDQGGTCDSWAARGG